MSAKISVIISAKNDGKNIVEPIKSAKLLSDDVLVFNIGKDKETASFAKKGGGASFGYPGHFLCGNNT